MIDLIALLKELTSVVSVAEQKELIWENPNPYNGMGSNIINFDGGSGLNKYDLIEIIYLESSQSGRNFYHSMTMPALSGSWGHLQAYSLGSGSYTTIMQRYVEIRDNGLSIYINVGEWRGVNETALYTANDPCVPVRIYGIKVGTAVNEPG